MIHLNGKEALRVNMPEGPIGPDTPAVAKARGRAWSDFALDPSLLTAGANLLAVEVHQKHGEQKPSSGLMLDLVF